MDKVTAAGEVIFNTDVDKTVDIAKNVNYNIIKNVATNVDLDGSLASAEASADSTGWDYNLAETETFAQVTTEGAFSFSDALAAGNFFSGDADGGTPTPPPHAARHAAADGRVSFGPLSVAIDRAPVRGPSSE